MSPCLCLCVSVFKSPAYFQAHAPVPPRSAGITEENFHSHLFNKQCFQSYLWKRPWKQYLLSSICPYVCPTATTHAALDILLVSYLIISNLLLASSFTPLLLCCNRTKSFPPRAPFNVFTFVPFYISIAMSPIFWP